MSVNLALRTRWPFCDSLCITGRLSRITTLRSLKRRELHALSRPGNPFRSRTWLEERLVARPRYRDFAIASLPGVLIPPVVFVGLLVALWTWKCMMMVVFQDKIIYMPSMPPFARSEKVADYEKTCRPCIWRTEYIRSVDSTKLALLIGTIPDEAANLPDPVKHVVICYFQGNGSSLPPRMPLLSNVLKLIKARSPEGDMTAYTIVALSYRGYWTSSGRASQSGIELDAQALLSYVRSTFGSRDTRLVLWGQSTGSGVATTAAARYISQAERNTPRVSSLILETPFVSIASMLTALYPQKWLPYRYLWPFLWNSWDSEKALRAIANSGKTLPNVLVLPGTRDEVVPPEAADQLEALCNDLEFPAERRNIEGALHHEVSSRRDGQAAIARFVVETSQ